MKASSSVYEQSAREIDLTNFLSGLMQVWNLQKYIFCRIGQTAPNLILIG